MGVVRGPLMPMRWSRKSVTVCSGSQSPVSSKAFWPASTSFHSMVLPCFFAAASSTSLEAGQMSTPMPSPSMKGIIGLSGTLSTPSALVVILVAMTFILRPIAWCLFGPKVPRPAAKRLAEQGVVYLSRRRRTVERVEVQTGGVGGQQSRAEFARGGNSFGPHRRRTTTSLGRLKTLHQSVGHRRAHLRHARDAVQGRHRHDARDNWLAHT